MTTTFSFDCYSAEEFDTFDVKVPSSGPSPDVRIHGVKSRASDSLPALLLIHGHPQNSNIWHKVAPILSKHFSIVATDLRGHGESFKPPGDENHETYSKRTMALDQIHVMKELGHEKFFVVGHDRGARVAHRLAVDHPESVLKLITLDIAPTLAHYEQTSEFFATKYWHWFFLIQPSPFPENFLIAAPDNYLSRFNLAGVPSSTFTPRALASYARNLHDPAAVHAMCEDYRASAPGGTDLTLDKEDIATGRKIQCPLKVFWGEKGIIGKAYDPLAEWRKVSAKEVSGRSLPTGHYIPEEMDPVDLSKEIYEFFTS